MAQINKPNEYFNTLLRNGTGSSVTAITGVGFQPDLIWQKKRSGTSSHHVTDSVRGATKLLYTEITAAEQTNANYVQSIDSDGFTMGSADWGTGDTVVAWNWLAGGSASSNTDGSITSSVSASTTSGFSIVSYTGNGTAGATVGHGLSQAPNMIISKKRNGTSDWVIGHDSLPSWDYYLQGLNTTSAQANSNNIWNDTSPSSSFYTIGTNAGVNTSSSTYIAYCFHSVKGFSKFGSYTGNGSTDGTFIYTGFKPAFLMIKCTTNSAFGNSNWMLYDNKRDPDNQMADYIYPNLSNAGATSSNGMDFLSNGIKMRNNFGDANYNNETYIYMAFAENPLVGTNNIPATAR